MTYSIIGRDPDRGEIGAAVQSKFPGVGSIALHGRAGVGCVTTQAFANPLHGENGLALLALGATPEEALPAGVGWMVEMRRTSGSEPTE